MDQSYLSKLYTKKREERIEALHKAGVIDAEYAVKLLRGIPLTDELADNFIENQIATYDLPLGVALNFVIDGKEYVIPMATEEPSVIAAASNAGKITKASGGFKTTRKNSRMIGQIALSDLPDLEKAKSILEEHTEEIIATANRAHPSIVKRGGGVKDLELRIIEADLIEKTPGFLVIHLHIDTQEAMGANMVNTMSEAAGDYIEGLVDGNILMSILSNYATESLVKAEVKIKPEELQTQDISGEDVRDEIVKASQFAWADPYRAATNNKGIMNGIDAVVIASGNDWRAVEAGVHAHAARSRQYRSLTRWEVDAEGNLQGSLEIPLALGSVGGSISLHPGAQMTCHILDYEDVAELERVVVSVGLAQNFSAVKALVTEGIQRGHMGLQAKSLALNVGAEDEEVDQVVALLKNAANMNTENAQKALRQVRSEY